MEKDDVRQDRESREERAKLPPSSILVPIPVGKLVLKVVRARPRNITTYTIAWRRVIGNLRKAGRGRVIDEAIERAQIY